MLHYYLRDGNKVKNMQIGEIKELIEIINNSDLAFFEYDFGDCHLKMDKSLTREYSAKVSEGHVSSPLKATESTVVEAVTQVQKAENTEAKAEKKVETEVINEEDLFIVKSPIVGTFYSAPSADKGNFVEKGNKVKKGDVLCIIEAMKLMNEIESDVDGEVVEILVKNEAMVEYGQPLFKIRRA